VRPGVEIEPLIESKTTLTHRSSGINERHIRFTEADECWRLIDLPKIRILAPISRKTDGFYWTYAIELQLKKIRWGH